MQLKKETAVKIARDAIISVFIYALPVILMFLYFYFSGQRPWEKSAAQQANSRTASGERTIQQSK